MRNCTNWIGCIALLLLAGCMPPEDTSSVAENEEAAAGGPVETERVKAQVGVGKQGQVIGDKEGFLRTPAKAFFNTKQKVVFDIQIPHALQLYEGLNDFEKPKTHEIFMEKIIKVNNIQLPELPEGQTYVWDPEAGELMVEKPKE